MKDRIPFVSVFGLQPRVSASLLFKLAFAVACSLLACQACLYAQECSGEPNFACSVGYPACVNGTWTCPCGSECSPLPPPEDICDSDPGGSAQCTNDGWVCQPGASPIIVDTTGKGFHLTSAAGGVIFDIADTGYPIQMSWTAPTSGNAFLALDRNGNGKIDNGKELFGNYTNQPKSEHPNGYLALAEFDKPENGGNGDGIIDSRDSVYSSLLLWIDENHDGISQPNELYSLPELGVYSIGLRYRDDQSYFDQYGNWFHYQGVLNPDLQDGESKDGRLTYDVFFVSSHKYPTTVPHSAVKPAYLLPSNAMLMPGLPAAEASRSCSRR
jgi:hypothetical protein